MEFDERVESGFIKPSKIRLLLTRRILRKQHSGLGMVCLSGWLCLLA